jgi:hypothetical protein
MNIPIIKPYKTIHHNEFIGRPIDRSTRVLNNLNAFIITEDPIKLAIAAELENETL